MTMNILYIYCKHQKSNLYNFIYLNVFLLYVIKYNITIYNILTIYY